MSSARKRFLYRNSLSIVFLLFFLASLAGQIYNGWQEHNDFLWRHKVAPASLGTYLRSGHFLQATFENWESEFLQMALFVIFTVFLRQHGSSESKDESENIIDPSELEAKSDSPWPVKRGGIYLGVYKHSLSIVLFLLFLFSFWAHWYGSWLDYNLEQSLEGQPTEKFLPFFSSRKLWFESFQNWQSEFLSVFTIVFFSIYLRQMGSPQSKQVNDPHSKTGAD